MPVDFDAIWEDLLADLKTLPAISFDGFARRIHFRARWNSDFNSLRRYIDTDQPYPAGDESHNQELDGMDTGSEFSRLGSYFLASEFFNIDDGAWQYIQEQLLTPVRSPTQSRRLSLRGKLISSTLSTRCFSLQWSSDSSCQCA